MLKVVELVKKEKTLQSGEKGPYCLLFSETFEHLVFKNSETIIFPNKILLD